MAGAGGWVLVGSRVCAGRRFVLASRALAGGWAALVSLGACSRAVEAPPAQVVVVGAPSGSASGQLPALAGASARATSPMGFATAGEPPLEVPASWTTCHADTDCSFASLGCCHTTPVNRTHLADANRALEASGERWCPPKAACGPGRDGTWADAPGTCHDGVCGTSPWPTR